MIVVEDQQQSGNLTYTINGALNYKSTNSYCLDLFSTIGSLRNLINSEAINYFARAYNENNSRALKILFFARDVREDLE